MPSSVTVPHVTTPFFLLFWIQLGSCSGRVWRQRYSWGTRPVPSPVSHTGHPLGCGLVACAFGLEQLPLPRCSPGTGDLAANQPKSWNGFRTQDENSELS